MNVTINGKSTQLSDVKTIADLIRSRGLKTSLVAVEQNGSIVPRSEFESKPVAGRRRTGDRSFRRRRLGQAVSASSISGSHTCLTKST